MMFLSEREHEQVFLSVFLFFYLQIKLPFIKKEEKKTSDNANIMNIMTFLVSKRPQILMHMVGHTLYQELWLKTTMVS